MRFNIFFEKLSLKHAEYCWENTVVDLYTVVELLLELQSVIARGVIDLHWKFFWRNNSNREFAS
jgi:hypothetical protein